METGSRRPIRAHAGSRRGRYRHPVLQAPPLGAADSESGLSGVRRVRPEVPEASMSAAAAIRRSGQVADAAIAHVMVTTGLDRVRAANVLVSRLIKRCRTVHRGQVLAQVHDLPAQPMTGRRVFSSSGPVSESFSRRIKLPGPFVLQCRLPRILQMSQIDQIVDQQELAELALVALLIPDAVLQFSLVIRYRTLTGQIECGGHDRHGHFLRRGRHRGGTPGSSTPWPCGRGRCTQRRHPLSPQRPAAVRCRPCWRTDHWPHGCSRCPSGHPVRTARSRRVAPRHGAAAPIPRRLLPNFRPPAEWDAVRTAPTPPAAPAEQRSAPPGSAVAIPRYAVRCRPGAWYRG